MRRLTLLLLAISTASVDRSLSGIGVTLRVATSLYNGFRDGLATGRHGRHRPDEDDSDRNLLIHLSGRHDLSHYVSVRDPRT